MLNHISRKITTIHGSRDYFQIKINDRIFFEVVPVKKVSNPKKAENITDLSYFHVKYIRQKVTDKICLFYRIPAYLVYDDTAGGNLCPLCHGSFP